jgi:hypothetical protein
LPKGRHSQKEALDLEFMVDQLPLSHWGESLSSLWRLLY